MPMLETHTTDVVLSQQRQEIDLLCSEFFSDQSNEDLSDVEKNPGSSSSDDDFFLDKIYEGASISTKEHAIAVLSHVVKNNSTLEATKDILQLIQLHLPKENYAAKSHTSWQSLLSSDTPKCFFLEYCSDCHSEWPSDDESAFQCTSVGCSGLRYKGPQEDQWKKKMKEYIVYFDAAAQIKDILERKDMWKKIANVKAQCSSSGSYNDIVDGEQYRRLASFGGPLHGPDRLSFTFFIDGVALYKSTKVSLWPIYLILNEIPAEERYKFKNMVLFGLWQGKGKSPTKPLLLPFSQAIKLWTTEGIIVNVDDADVVSVKVFPILCCMDLPAKAQFLTMVTFNGYYGCKDCLIYGKHVAVGKGNTHIYPYDEALTAEKRSSQQFLAHGQFAERAGVSRFGVKSVPFISTIDESYDVIGGTIIDYMHGVLLGVTKKFLHMWFDPSVHKVYKRANKSYPEYYIGHAISEVEDRLLAMKPPDCISRLPRKISDFKQFKANEFRSWLLYYSVPCLWGILPRVYLNHFILLIESIHILLGTSISDDELALADRQLCRFYELCESLYEHNPEICGLNVHNLIHLTDQVRSWGPLWCYSAFSFESLNGRLIKFVHGTRACHFQVIRMFSHLKLINRLRESDDTSGPLASFMAATNSKRPKRLAAYGSSYSVGKPRSLNRYEQRTISDLLGRKIDFTSSGKCFRIYQRGSVYYAREYSRMERRISYAVLASENEHNLVLEVQWFFLFNDEKKIFAVGRELPRANIWWFQSDDGVLRHVMKLDGQRGSIRIVPADAIIEKVVYLDGNPDLPCVATVPNIFESD